MILNQVYVRGSQVIMVLICWATHVLQKLSQKIYYVNKKKFLKIIQVLIIYCNEYVWSWNH